MHDGVSSLRRPRLLAGIIALSMLAIVLPLVPARAVSPDIVVSQVYGG